MSKRQPDKRSDIGWQDSGYIVAATEGAPQVMRPGGPQAIFATGNRLLCLATLATDSSRHSLPRRV